MFEYLVSLGGIVWEEFKDMTLGNVSLGVGLEALKTDAIAG